MTTPVVDPFEIDELAGDTLANSMKSGEAIELPFPAMYFWTHNGQPNMKSSGVPVLYHGGWIGKQDQIEEAVQKSDQHLPDGWKPIEITPTDGKPYQAYSSRAFYIAPIAYRRRWVTNEGKSFPISNEYQDGYRQHLQLLALCGLPTQTQSVIAYMPIVLTGKGFQVSFITGAMSEFSKAIESERRKNCAKIPVTCFWRRIGTFGQEPTFQDVGKKVTHKVTPITVGVPDPVNRDVLAKMYVGKVNAATMSELYSQAQEWLHAWDGNGKPGQAPEPPPLVDDQF